MNTSLSEANHQWIGSCHQKPVRVPSHIPTGYIVVQWLRQTTDPLIWLPFIGAKYTVICNSVVLPYIEQGVTSATPDISMQGPICSDQECVIELRVDWYKSIQSTGLQYMDYRLSTYLLYDSACLKMSYSLMLTTPHPPRNNLLEHEWIVVCSATRNKVSCR